jgi:hypothetical protein
MESWSHEAYNMHRGCPINQEKVQINISHPTGAAM